MKYIEKLLIALKGLMKWLIENISNEIENALKEDNMGQNKQKQENYKNSESLHPNDLVTEEKTMKSNNPIWYDKEYNEDEKGNMRWEFEIWNFGYSDAFEYCKDIWLAFGYNIVLLEYEDMVVTMAWVFSINDLTCIWYYNDYPPYHYILPCKETEENLNKLENYIKVVVNELNKCVKNNEIKPLM